MTGITSPSGIDLDVPVGQQKFFSGWMVRRHHRFLIIGLHQLLVRKALCDFTFYHETCQLEAHKIVLAASSPVFHTMFLTTWKPGGYNHFAAYDIDAEIVSRIISYSYPGVKVEEVTDCTLEIECMSLEFFNMSELMQHRCDVSMVDMEFHLLVRRWRVAAIHKLEGTAKQIVHYLLTNFECFLRSPYFVQIPFELLAAVLSCEDERLVNEYLLCCAVNQWILHSPLLRISYIESLLICMRATMNLRGNFLATICDKMSGSPSRGKSRSPCRSPSHCSDSSTPPRRHSSTKLRSPKPSSHVLSSETSVGVLNSPDEKRETAFAGSPEHKNEPMKVIAKFPPVPLLQEQTSPMCDRLLDYVEKLWEGPRESRSPTPVPISASDTATNKCPLVIELPIDEKFRVSPPPKKKPRTPDPHQTLGKPSMKGLGTSLERKPSGHFTSSGQEDWTQPGSVTVPARQKDDDLNNVIDVFVNAHKSSTNKNEPERRLFPANYSGKQKLDDLIQTMRTKLDAGTSSSHQVSRKEEATPRGSFLYRNGKLEQPDTIKTLSTMCNRIAHPDQPSSFQAFKLERSRISNTDSQNFSTFHDQRETSNGIMQAIESKGISTRELNKNSCLSAKHEMTKIYSSSTSPSSSGSLSPLPNLQPSFVNEEWDSSNSKKMCVVFNDHENASLSPTIKMNVCESFNSAPLPSAKPYYPERSTDQLFAMSASDSRPTAFGLRLPTISQSRITPEEIEKRLEKFKQVMNLDNSALKAINLKGSQSFVIPCIGESEESVISDLEGDSYWIPSSDDEHYYRTAALEWNNFDNGYYRVLSTIPEECQDDIVSSISSTRTDVSSCPQTSPTSVDGNPLHRKPWELPSNSLGEQNIEIQQSAFNTRRIDSPISTKNEGCESSSVRYPLWVTKRCEANKTCSHCPVPCWKSELTPKELHAVDEANESTVQEDAREEKIMLSSDNNGSANHPVIEEMVHVTLGCSKTDSITTLNIGKNSPGFRLNLKDKGRTVSPILSPSSPPVPSSASYEDILSSPRSSPDQRNSVCPIQQLNLLPHWLDKLYGNPDPTNSPTQSLSTPRSSFSVWSPRMPKSERSPTLTPESVGAMMLPDTPSSSLLSFNSEKLAVCPSECKTEVVVKEDLGGNVTLRTAETGEFDELASAPDKPMPCQENLILQHAGWTAAFAGPCSNKLAKEDLSQQNEGTCCKESMYINQDSPKHVARKPVPHYKKYISRHGTSTSGETITLRIDKNKQTKPRETSPCKKSDTSVFVSLKELEVVTDEPDTPPPLTSTQRNQELKKPHKNSERNYTPVFSKNCSVPAFFCLGTNASSKTATVSQKITAGQPWTLENYGSPVTVHSDTRDYISSDKNNIEFEISSQTLSCYSDQREYNGSSKQKNNFQHSFDEPNRKGKNAHQTGYNIASHWEDVDMPEVLVRRKDAVFLPISMLSETNKSDSTHNSQTKDMNSRFTDTLMESDTSTIGGKEEDPFPKRRKELNFLPCNVGPVLVFLSENNNGIAHRYCYSLREKVWLPPLTLIVPDGVNNCSIAYYENKIYFIGGDADSVYRRHSNMRAYNCLKNCLEILANMGLARVDAGVTVFDEHIYVIGGLGRYHKPLAQVERYNIANDTWKLIAAMRHARSSLSIATVSGLIYAIGGIVNSNKSLSMVTRVCERYDPTIDQWSEIENLPSHFDTFIPLVVAIGERLYAVRIKAPEKVYTFNMNRCKWMAIKDSRLAACSISVLLPGEWRMYAVSASAKIIFVFDLHAYQWQIENHFPEEVKWMQLAYSMNLLD